MVEFSIPFTGIIQSPESRLSFARAQLRALNVLLSFKLSRGDKRRYESERNTLLTEMASIELEIQESKNPSQLVLF